VTSTNLSPGRDSRDSGMQGICQYYLRPARTAQCPFRRLGDERASACELEMIARSGRGVLSVREISVQDRVRGAFFFLSPALPALRSVLTDLPLQALAASSKPPQRAARLRLRFPGLLHANTPDHRRIGLPPTRVRC
jgi:hypothetical protein